MPEDTFSRFLHSWIKKNNLDTNPFESFEAYKERQFLNYVFVDRPYFHQILGNPLYPCPAFLFAGRGDGKTTTREMIVYECIHAEENRNALPVRHYDFSRLLEQSSDNPSAITLRQHVAQIIRQIIRTLAMQDIVPSLTFDDIADSDRALLAGYAAQFADPITQSYFNSLLNTNPPAVQWDNFSPFELLQPLAELVTRLQPPKSKPFKSIYILVDQVDETSAGPDAVLDILRPLVRDNTLLETPGVAFKFFLPAGLNEAVRQTLPIRLDRVIIEQITWDREDLKAMIDRRLHFFSHGAVTSLADMCDTSARYKAMDRLIAACDNSPRTLLRLCDQLLRNHVTADPYNWLISLQSLNMTISNHIQQREVQLARPSESRPAGEPAAPFTPVKEGLCLDEGGQIWIDGKQLAEPLTEKEFALFNKLNRLPGKIVSQEELISEIWPASAQGEDEQNLRKLVARLREHLEDGQDNRKSRFIKSVKGRGYYLSYK